MLPVYTGIFQHIDNHLVNYTTEKCQAVSQLISPAVEGGASIYILLQGYNHWMGSVEQPFQEFVKMTLKIAAILGVALTIGNYNSLVVDTFQNTPVQLAAAISDGNVTTLNGIGGVLDGIEANVVDVGLSFFNVSSFSLSAIGYSLVGIAVFAVGTITTLLIAAYIVMAKITTAVTLALGPLFISFALFESTKNYFNQFLNTLSQYATLIVLSVGVNSLIMSMFSQSASDLAKLGAGAQIADLTALFITGGIAIYILLQVPAWASSLAGGVALSTGGLNRTLMGATAGKAWNLATMKQSRDVNREAKNRLAVNKRMSELEAKAAPKATDGGEVSRTTRKGPRVEATRRTVNFD
ncbi:MAG: TrbL/VirB6 family protein [Burkholderiales bacterium]